MVNKSLVEACKAVESCEYTRITRYQTDLRFLAFGVTGTAVIFATLVLTVVAFTFVVDLPMALFAGAAICFGDTIFDLVTKDARSP